MQPDQFDMFTQTITLPIFDADVGETLKRRVMGIVFNNQSESWSLIARELMMTYIEASGPCLMEAARRFALACGLPPPTHPNAWGAATGALSKAGLIVMTGAWTKAESIKSHAAMYPLWRAR